MIKDYPKKCKKCDIFKENCSKICAQDDSVFDAILDIDRFVEDCLKTCVVSDEPDNT